MAGYIGTRIAVPETRTESKSVINITATTTSLTGLSYTPTQVEVFHNGVRLVDGTDFTATNGTSITLTTAAQNGDQVVVLSSDSLNVANVVPATGGTFSGNVTFSGDITADGGTIKLDGNYPVGTNNVALGNTALDSNVSGASNTAIGADALTANTASGNTAVGYQAGYSNTTGASITAVGQNALRSSTTASNNVAVGQDSLYTLTTGTANVVVGTAAARGMTTGNFNTVVGQEALKSNTTAERNTAVGYRAGYALTTGGANVVMGDNAFQAATTGDNNVAIGTYALADATGRLNTAIGSGAGSLITSGAKNTILGRYNGNQGGRDIRTTDNNIVLSDGDGNPRVWINASNDFYTGPTNTTAGFINYNSSGGQDFYRATSNTGFGVGHWFSDVGGTRAFKAYVDASGNFNTSSDYRIKENVIDVTGATDRIKSLRPVSYNQIGSDQHQEGFIAHEVQQVVPHVVSGEKDQVKSDGSIFVQTVNYSGLIATLTAALKESITRIEQLEAEVATLKGS